MNKNDNILDAEDKNKGPRSCPECGYQFSLLLFVKRYVMKFGFPKWTCPNCGKFIKYNYVKTNLISFIIFFVCIFLFQGLQVKFEWDLPNYIFLFPYFILFLIILNFDTLEQYK